MAREKNCNIVFPNWRVKASIPARESRASTATENCTLELERATQSTEPCCAKFGPPLELPATSVPDMLKNLSQIGRDRNMRNEYICKDGGVLSVAFNCSMKQNLPHFETELQYQVLERQQITVPNSEIELTVSMRTFLPVSNT